MENGRPPEIAKRIKFLSFVLGAAGGVTLVLLGMSLYLRSPFLIVIAIGLGITTVPLVRSIGRLRKTLTPSD